LIITGAMLRDSIISGANNIKNHSASVDELNVFPVPDGDTGTNMSMTMGHAVTELANLPDNVTVEKVSAVVSSALLRGARGNSGVILSLIFRGFAKEMQGKKDATASNIVNSLKYGVEAAYKAVMKPTEGTILTVVRISAEKAAGKLDEINDPVEIFDYILEVAEDTLDRTPEMLPVLKKAGVVDSGGMGLLIIFQGMQEVFKKGKIVELAENGTKAEAAKGVFTDGIAEGLTNSYCTEFLVIKEKGIQADANKLKKDLEEIGDSIVVVDDSELIKCHVHTETPDIALGKALKHGYLSQIKIENMLEQYMRLQASKGEEHAIEFDKVPEVFEYVPVSEDAEEYGFVAVSAGSGLANLFSELGVSKTVEGGQSMNPSTEEILSASQSIDAKNIFVLANNKNIILSAEQASKLADRNIVIIPTKSIPEGISAMLVFNPELDLDNNRILMNEAIKSVKSGSVTYAARNSDFDGRNIREGEILALEDGKLSFTDTDPEKAAIKLARRLCSRDTNFVTVIYGADVTEEKANSVLEALEGRLGKNIEISLVSGNQPIYYYYISAE
jgi:DAK2 domain fusion protein YloV